MQEIAVQGICYDLKSSYLRGSADAPVVIRRCFHTASSSYFSEKGIDLKNLFANDLGDFVISDYFDIEKITARHLKPDVRLLTLGGDHSITYPIILAYATVFPDLQILQIDAHDDLYPVYQDDLYSHACPFARIMEKRLAVQLIQVGIRSLGTHVPAQLAKYPIHQYHMFNLDIAAIEIDPSIPIYISMDMDALDPAFAPGISHPEPGGMTTRQVIQLIQNIPAQVVGADIVEYNPRQDQHELTGMCATKILKEIAAKMMEA